jgi:methyl-accepting chemotaxis protein
MENSILIAILVVQMAAMLMIALILFATARRVKKFSDRIKALSDGAKGLLDSVEPKVDEIMKDMEAFIRSWEQVGEHMIELSAGLRDIAETAKETADDVADVVQDTALRAERQIDHMDHLFSDAMDRTQIAAEYVTRSVLPQLVEIAAMIKGIFATINYLRGKRHFPFAE